MLKFPHSSTILGIAALVASGVIAGSAEAAPVNRLSAFTLSQSADLVAATTTTEGATSISSSQNIVGIVKSVNGSTLEIKLPDGQVQTYAAPSNFAASTLTPGSFVEVTMDENQAIQEVKIPSVEKVISGVISNIEGDNVTLELADGTQETTVINEATAQRMNLAPGVPLTVTSYAGLTATKLCPTLLATCCQKPTPPAPLSIPVGGGNISAPPPQPVPQKW